MSQDRMSEQETFRRLVLGAVVASVAITGLAAATSLVRSQPLLAGAPYPFATQVAVFGLAALAGTLAGATLLQWLSYRLPIRPVVREP